MGWMGWNGKRDGSENGMELENGSIRKSFIMCILQFVLSPKQALNG
jgi:hypothetical protein